MVVIPAVLLNNISQTVHNLMTGVYNRHYFYSPYNEMVADELKGKTGRAYETYSGLLGIMEILYGILEMDLQELENLEDSILNLQEVLLNDSFKKGYMDAVGISLVPGPVYNGCLGKKGLLPDEAGGAYYSEVLKNLDAVRNRLGDFGIAGMENMEKLDSITDLLDRRFSILCGIAETHGRSLALGVLPVWSNPELSYTNYCVYAERPTFTQKEIVELYNRESENWTLKPSFFQCFRTGQKDLQACLDSIFHKFPPELQHEAENLFFVHDLIETADLQNMFAEGFRQGMRLSVEALYSPVSGKRGTWTE